MKFNREGKHHEELQINITPLIDIVFLLLIFFMISATFTGNQHLSIMLPKAEHTEASTLNNPIHVFINEKGLFAIDNTQLFNNDLQTLKHALAEVKMDSSQKLIITADAKTPYQYVINVMDIAGKLGIVNINMATQNP